MLNSSNALLRKLISVKSVTTTAKASDQHTAKVNTVREGLPTEYENEVGEPVGELIVAIDGSKNTRTESASTDD